MRWTGTKKRTHGCFTARFRRLIGVNAPGVPRIRQTAVKVPARAYLREAAFHPGADGTITESELRVDYPNGGQVRLYGADNPDALRGLYLDGVVLDEYADMDPRLWSAVIRPSLSDRQGWAVFIGTPKGHNAFYEMWAGDR